jgi:hypothetical protein
MKLKIIIVAILLLQTITIANAANNIWIEAPAQVTKGDTFNATIYVNVTDSWGIFIYNLTWNPSIITATNSTNQNDWELKYSYGGGLKPGYLMYANWWRGGTHKTGVIPLLTINFLATSKGTATFDFLTTPSIYSHTMDESADITELTATPISITVKDTPSNGGGNGGGDDDDDTPTPPTNQPPIAVITMPPNGTTNTTIAFYGNASYDPDGTITAYLWTFGDEYTATTPNTEHVFNYPATYAITLTATDDDGAVGTTTEYITITQPQTNPTNQTDNNTIPPPANNTDTNDTKPDYVEIWNFPIFVVIFSVAIALCIVFYYMYRKSTR